MARLIQLVKRYRVRGPDLTTDTLQVESILGAVVGDAFRCRTAAGLERIPLTDLSLSVEKAVKRYVKLDTTDAATRLWVRETNPEVRVVGL